MFICLKKFENQSSSKKTKANKQTNKTLPALSFSGFSTVIVGQFCSLWMTLVHKRPDTTRKRWGEIQFDKKQNKKTQ